MRKLIQKIIRWANKDDSEQAKVEIHELQKEVEYKMKSENMQQIEKSIDDLREEVRAIEKHLEISVIPSHEKYRVRPYQREVGTSATFGVSGSIGGPLKK